MRSQRLIMYEGMQTDIGFSETAIKVGSIVIQLQEIEDYILWPTKLFSKTMNEARAKGYIKESEWYPDIMNS